MLRIINIHLQFVERESRQHFTSVRMKAKPSCTQTCVCVIISYRTLIAEYTGLHSKYPSMCKIFKGSWVRLDPSALSISIGSACGKTPIIET